MTILISYDVSDKQVEFKKTLIALKYEDTFLISGVKKPLPESTLCKAGSNEKAAISDTVTAAKNLKIKLERAVAVNVAGIDMYT